MINQQPKAFKLLFAKLPPPRSRRQGHMFGSWFDQHQGSTSAQGGMSPVFNCVKIQIFKVHSLPGNIEIMAPWNDVDITWLTMCFWWDRCRVSSIFKKTVSTGLKPTCCMLLFCGGGGQLMKIFIYNSCFEITNVMWFQSCGLNKYRLVKLFTWKINWLESPTSLKHSLLWKIGFLKYFTAECVPCMTSSCGWNQTYRSVHFVFFHPRS